VKVVGDVQLLAGSIVVAGSDGDSSVVTGIVAEIDAENFVAGGVLDLDLCSSEVVVEQLNVRGVARTIDITWTARDTAATVIVRGQMRDIDMRVEGSTYMPMDLLENPGEFT
jgi:hypothetical protein